VRRVLVWSNDPVGATMAGPGIRYLHFARELSRVADVTLAAPVTPTGERFEVRSTAEVRRLSTRGLASFDAVVAQSIPWRLARGFLRTGGQTVLDLYAPALVEPLAYLASEPGPLRTRQLRYDESRAVQLAGLKTADSFLCASERQRDLWIGALGAAGRLSLGEWDEDPGFRSLVAVVPFGLEAEVPAPTARVLRGVRPEIAEDDVICLWGGGLWNWFDPLTVIEAVGQLATERNDVKLVFLGITHPSRAVERMTMVDRALERARQLGLTDRQVFFNEGWVPYLERHNYLLEADIGVSAHFDTLETRYAFRTRMLDYLWASRPVVCTGGDVLGDLVGKRGAGLVLAERDVQGWVEALRRLADRRDEREAMRSRAGELRAEFVWSRVCEPLVELVSGARQPAANGRRARRAFAWSGLVRTRSSLARRGVRGTVGASVRALRDRARS
jgi:glycosyltransferase involved in cell wall biosynthesis